jgi:hypothetical protein
MCKNNQRMKTNFSHRRLMRLTGTLIYLIISCDLTDKSYSYRNVVFTCLESSAIYGLFLNGFFKKC